MAGFGELEKVGAEALITYLLPKEEIVQDVEEMLKTLRWLDILDVYAHTNGQILIIERRKVEEIPSYHRDAELIEQFKKDVSSGSLANVLA